MMCANVFEEKTNPLKMKIITYRAFILKDDKTVFYYKKGTLYYIMKYTFESIDTYDCQHEVAMYVRRMVVREHLPLSIYNMIK